MSSSPAHACVSRAEAPGPRVNGVRLDPLAEHELPGFVDAFVRCGGSHVIHFVPADPTVRARRDPGYRGVLNRGDLNVADGAGVVWALRACGHRAPRITGSRALEMLTERAGDGQLRHFLCGGTGEVVESLTERLRARNPDVRIVGAEAPPFAPVDLLDLEGVAARARAARADLVWLGLGTPKQDLAAERLREMGAAPVVLCVGAAFDFVAGAKRRAPRWMQRLGLEWLDRLVREPKRLWRRYLIGHPRFVAGVVRDLVTTRKDGG